MASYWTDIDTWLLGQYSGDPALSAVVQKFTTELLQSPTAWHADQDNWPVPSLIVFGSRVFSEPAAQKRRSNSPSDRLALNKMYPYTVIVMARGTLLEATEQAKVLFHLVEEVNVKLRFNLTGIAPDPVTDEAAQQVHLGESRIAIYKNPLNYFGVVITSLQVDTNLP